MDTGFRRVLATGLPLVYSAESHGSGYSWSGPSPPGVSPRPTGWVHGGCAPQSDCRSSASPLPYGATAEHRSTVKIRVSLLRSPTQRDTTRGSARRAGSVKCLSILNCPQIIVVALGPESTTPGTSCWIAVTSKLRLN